MGDFSQEGVGKEYYEVIGTQKAGNTIDPMQCVHLGDKFGARASERVAGGGGGG